MLAMAVLTIPGKHSRQTEGPADSKRSKRQKRVIKPKHEDVDPHDGQCAPQQYDSECIARPSHVETETCLTNELRYANLRLVEHATSEITTSISPSLIHSGPCSVEERPCTPSEYDSSSQIPETPRHCRLLSKKIPVTPRHRDILRCHTPEPRTPGSSPLTHSRLVGCALANASKIFNRNANSGPLIGRVEQRNILQKFLATSIGVSKGGCIHVLGPPGTGKSALVREVCLGTKFNAVQVYINCMSIRSADDLFSLLISEMNVPAQVPQANLVDLLQSAFRQKPGRIPVLITLDEVDELLKLDMDALLRLTEWSFRKNSMLALICIANAIDLTDQLWSRIKRGNKKPQLLPFLPYTAEEIVAILTARARSIIPIQSKVAANFTPLLEAAAIQLISKRIALQSGDIRKAFDIAEQVVELVVKETLGGLSGDVACKQKICSNTPSRAPLTDHINSSSVAPAGLPIESKSVGKTSLPTWSPAAHLDQCGVEDAPQATLAHVIRATSAAFVGSTSKRLHALNLQQKAVLCSLVALQERSEAVKASFLSSLKTRGCPMKTPTQDKTNGYGPKSAAPTLRNLFHAYTLMCARNDALRALSWLEFYDVVGTLEAMNLIVSTTRCVISPRGSTTPTKRGSSRSWVGKHAGESMLSTCMSVAELKGALRGLGSGILTNILCVDKMDDLCAMEC